MNQKNNGERHNDVCQELNNLYRKKNHDYGDSFHASFDKWGLTMVAIRLSDKLSRLETLVKGEREVKDESLRDTLIDLANYSIMAVMELDNKKPEMKPAKQYRAVCQECGTAWTFSESKPKSNAIKIGQYAAQCPNCGAYIPVVPGESVERDE